MPLDPQLRAHMSATELASMKAGLAVGLHAVFLACALLSIAGLVITLFFPAGVPSEHAHKDVAVPETV